VTPPLVDENIFTGGVKENDSISKGFTDVKEPHFNLKYDVVNTYNKNISNYTYVNVEIDY
jgi:hypothetical protein